MKTMRFEEFTQAVVDKIKEFLPQTFEDAIVELQTVIKNNNLQLTGLTIRSNESGACPLIYLEDFFAAYEAGEDMGRVLERIADVRIKNDVMDAFDTDEITDFYRVKDKIVARLINRKWNSELLSDRPYTEVADLAATYHVQFGEEFSVPVTRSLMESWGVDVDTLHKRAVRNTSRLLPSIFKGMSAALFGAADEEIAPEEEALFVLTNYTGTFGAAAVLDERIMSKITGMFDEAYFLPSSIHEWIVVPSTPDMDVRQLVEMVKSANASVVSPDERLGEHVYFYTMQDGLQIAG